MVTSREVRQAGRIPAIFFVFMYRGEKEQMRVRREIAYFAGGNIRKEPKHSVA